MKKSNIPLGCRILLGTRLAHLISIISFGQGKHIASYIAIDLLGFKSCGCCERQEFLDKLFCKSHNGNCNQIKLF